METITKLEITVADWYKNAPHLPKNSQKWLAENVWWIVLIGILVGALGIWGLFAILFLTSAVLVGLGGVAGVVLSGALWVASFIAFIFLAINLALASVAITPLKLLQKKGWRLLFIIALVNVAATLIEFVFTYNLMEVIGKLLYSAIGAYFLFEIRGYFNVVYLAKKTEVKKAE